MVKTNINSVNVGSLGNTVCIMGSSNNIDIPNFKTQLSKYNVQYLDITDLHKIPQSTVVLTSVGNDDDFSRVVNYVVNNRSNLSNLNNVYQYGLYSNQTQIDILKNIGITSYPTINYNSSQPFLDSCYSTISRPPYLSNLTNFVYLSNILFQFSPKLLFDFGYYIDIYTPLDV